MMDSSQLYIPILLVTLAVVAILVFIVGRKREGKRLTPLAGLAFGFVLAGLLYGDERIVGYILIGVGLILAVMDIMGKRRKQE